jgi:MYXO-CTERM domain-containing protein
MQTVTNTAPACAPGANCPTPGVPAPAPSGGWCVPPYYGASSGGDLQVPSTPTTGTGVSGPGTPTKGGTGSAGTTSTGTPNEGTPTPGSTGQAESHESSACAMGHAPASSGALALLAMLGALFGLKRRRA